ncbi:MAG: helix-turn-helix domain-containing protein [Actinomycetota bacterium]|nr:helix-turn-helix domain-containing protein [Actinomycetota bacterium]
MSRSARRPDELSTALRRLRSDADLSGMEAARLAGYSQPKISRFETARQVPSTEEVHVLCRVYGAAPEVRDRLRQFQKIITEGALRWHVGSPQIMAAQLEHLRLPPLCIAGPFLEWTPLFPDSDQAGCGVEGIAAWWPTEPGRWME